MILLRVHLSDECNRRCPSCHWFGQSGEPVVHAGPEAADVLAAVERARAVLPAVGLVLTGGEPTLWEPLPEFINALPPGATLTVFTNGILAARLLPVRRRAILLLNACAETDEAAVAGLRRRGWSVNRNPLPAGTPRDQFVRAEGFRHLLGREVRCRGGGGWRFATDGRAYACEIGVRAKDPTLRLPVSLREGAFNTVQPPWFACVVREDCLSAFGCDQRFEEVSP